MRGFFRTALAVLSACCSAVVRWFGNLVPEARREPTRDLVVEELRKAEVGIARVAEEEAEVVGREAMAHTMRVRGTRAPRTQHAAGRALRMIREFVEANPGLMASARGTPSHVTYDTIVEAFVFAEEAGAAGDTCPWRRARRPQDASAARTAGAARAALERTGWSRGSTWSRARAMAKAWGVNDPEDVQHHRPIFVWELVEGLRLAPAPKAPWELCGVAMAVVSALGARRGGGAAAVKVGEVAITGPDVVEVAPRARPKQHRERASRRPRRQARPVVLRHWLIAAHVVPWIRWHQRKKSPPSALLFPRISRDRPRNASSLGFSAERQWVEPVQEWTPRQRKAILTQYVHNLGDRTFHGFRSGNQCELRRWPQVSAVTRRVLHERSVRHLIGSEAAYDEVFAEDFAEAVERLGQLRIERTPAGLLSVVASSESAGRLPGDWKTIPGGPLTLPADEAQRAEAAAVADGTSSSGASSDDDAVVGDGDRATRVFNCGRCGQRLAARDYGYLCDIRGCKWGTCTTCHPGGAKTELRCPKHQVGK